jgi:hypothetical protein
VQRLAAQLIDRSASFVPARSNGKPALVALPPPAGGRKGTVTK